MSANKSINITAPSSQFYKGPYGRLFPNLPPWSEQLPRDVSIEGLIKKITKTMRESEHSFSFLASSANVKILDALDKNNDMDHLPAGYTYFGQFIDHDMTFDPSSSLMRRSDPNGIQNFRTPRLDLDSIYGGGPNRSPHLYSKEKPHKFAYTIREYEEVESLVFKELRDNGVKVGESRNEGDRKATIADLQRNFEGIALISDPRNDENMIVSQLHLAFQLAHNQLVARAVDKNTEHLAAGKPPIYTDPFESARTTLRWLYQYIVWNDFLNKICNGDVHNHALTENTTHLKVCWEQGYKHVYDWKEQPFIPIEFSVAAYRLGHSMVRTLYETNSIRRAKNFIPIFGSATADMEDNLKGGRKISVLQAIQWDWFLNTAKRKDKRFPQKARKIDPKLSSALFQLPENPEMSLAYRNLMRGHNFDLPSGTSVAKYLGVEPIVIDPNHDALWYYILAEAEQQANGQHLGEVGSIIVCSTFAGLLTGDPSSYFRMNPKWTPYSDSLLSGADENNDGEFDLSSIIKLSGLNPESIEFPDKLKE